jgi:hypothetical protein
VVGVRARSRVHQFFHELAPEQQLEELIDACNAWTALYPKLINQRRILAANHGLGRRQVFGLDVGDQGVEPVQQR